MLNIGKVLGGLFMAAAGLAALLVVGWGAANLSEGNLQISGFIFLLILSAPLIAGLGGAGLFLFLRGRAEEAQLAEVAKERKLLNMIETRGEVRIADAALELDVPRDVVQQYVYDLVGKGLFSGYINWDEGVLYARQARLLREQGTCPNCGGQLELAGKGVVRCPYCGTEIFL